MIEFFAVPGALVGTALYPLGLDAWVWHVLGFGITIVLAIARLIGAAPGATLHVVGFAPWAIFFLALAVLSAVIWRSLLLRLTAVPLALFGIWGATAGERFDVAIPPSGEALAVRGASGRIEVIGARPDLFAASQWLADAGDAHAPADSVITARKPAAEADAPRCDRLGCAAILADGRRLALVLDQEAFLEDCRAADIIVTPLRAPASCGGELVIDRRTLAADGAMTLTLDEEKIRVHSARAPGEDRPWSRPPPSVRPRAPVVSTPSAEDDARAEEWLTAPLDQ